MRLPHARGPVSAHLTTALLRAPGSLGVPPALDPAADPLTDEDEQLALFVCYELHYRGFDRVDEAWEWDLGLLNLRARLERRFERSLRAIVPAPEHEAVDVARALTALVDAGEGPSLSVYLQRKATRRQFEEFVIHRSVYHLKEADPHTWAIPRFSGRAKAALVEIQSDEYGGGRPDRMHQAMFARTMRGLGLDDSYGAYIDAVPAVTLSTSNVISLFGLHRRLRGALAGHLAAFEMTSSEPNRRYSAGVRRVGGGQAAADFYDEHITADAVHEQIAVHDLCGSLVRAEPHLAGDVLFGAACALHLDARAATHLLGRWEENGSSLRAAPYPAARPA